MNKYTSIWFKDMGLDQWLNISLNTLGNSICLTVNLYLIFTKGNIDPGLAVLLFTNVVGLPGAINVYI